MRLGVMFDRDLPPEQLIPFARQLDDTSVDDLWVVEDLGWTGAISAAATALAVTSRLRVCIGITPAPLRNPALLAMELANLARLHPGRLVAGIGHGVQSWMRQVGAAAASPLALLEETLISVQSLMRGEQVTLHGREVTLDGIRLVHPAEAIPPVMAGVLGPRSLAVSGRVAQGTIVPEGFGPKEIRDALTHIAAPGDHELVVFTHLYVGDSPDLLDPIRRDVGEFVGKAPADVPMATGSPAEITAYIKTLHDAGADTVVLRPVGPDPLPHVLAIL
ncbi:LLM class flavin-dependent oxidoreductase [Nonomuraea sp. NPDC050556]|uniref:LLM class flavin-dependent oxidoreductase n=1 Tax=Nonomuraea sp. NPDC050556 TaxID=3364369 RepID=UPI0037AC358F